MDTLIARTADGIALAIDRVHAQGRSRGAVVFLHAMMTDGRYFGARAPDGLAAYVAAQGLDAFVAHFRGHGASAAPELADWSFDDLVELDLPAIVGRVAEATGRAPSDVAIVGHSLGGLVATAAIGTGRIAPPRALALLATCVWLGGRRAPLRRRAIMATYRATASLLGRAPVRALRIGTVDEPRTYVRQVTGWSTTGRWTNRAGHDYAEALAHVTAPTLAFCGRGDWMCTPADAAGFAGLIPGAAPVIQVGKAHGDPIDPDHFTLITHPELIKLRARIVELATEAR